MSYYPPETEIVIKELEKELDQEAYTNVLTQMDNWTYHIRLSMLPFDAYNQYLKYKDEALLENKPNIKKMQQIVDSKGIVVAETGVLNNIFIDSLTLKTISSVGKSLTTEGKLTLVDLEGTGLVNKLNILSMMTGNGSYFSNQVYFLTIWFVGYNGTNTFGENNIDMPNSEIDVFEPLKTYSSKQQTENSNTYLPTYFDKSTSKIYLETVFTDVKCATTTNKATWSMNFVSTNSSFLTPQEVCVLSDIPEIKINKGERYLEVVSNMLSQKINEKIKSQLGEYAFKAAYFDKNNSTVATTDKISCFDITVRNEYKDILFTTIQLDNKKATNKNNVTTNVNQSMPNDYTLKFNSSTNLLNVFNTLITEANKDNKNVNYAPRITVYNKPMNIYAGKRYYHTFITLWLQYTPGMDVCMSCTTNPEKLKDIQSIQNKTLKGTKEHNNMFIRKYEWMTGNNKNGLLSYDSNKNNLWYLNTGMADKESAAHNTLNGQARTLNAEETNFKKINYNSSVKATYVLPANLKNINDIWEYAKETNFINTLPLYSVAIKDSNIGANDPITNTPGTAQENIGRAAARIGYQNLLTSGNAITIKLNIIGDPIWLDLGSVVSPNDISTSLNMMILFKENTTFNIDSLDNYQPDPYLQSINPYIITEITSDFCNGAFKQTLNGFVPADFLFDKNTIDELTKIKIIDGEGSKTTENNNTLTTTNSVSSTMR